jgi:dienelactone hydrolase
MGMWNLLILLACGGPTVNPAEPQRLRDALGLGVIPRAPLAPIEGAATVVEGLRVIPVSLQLYPGLRVSAALWLPPGDGPFDAALVAHGHFGEGKTAGESQAPAFALARAGYAALAIDTLGVEEGDLPGRRVHFEGGAHNRALLVAGGSSAMATQLEGLQAGVQYLQSRGDVDQIVVVGASGGAVQAHYLSVLDPTIVGAVLAAYVPTPREARAGGCACDAVPGWPGPDPSLTAALSQPSLWLTELDQAAPAGLPRRAEHEVLVGPHSYTEPMIAETLAFLGELLDGAGSADLNQLPNLPAEALRSADVGPAALADVLQPAHPPRWRPDPDLDTPYTLTCDGAGPVVIAAGARDDELRVLVQAGLKVCALAVSFDEVDQEAGLITQRPYVDRFAGALLSAARRERAGALYVTRAWGVAAEGAGLPYALREPLTRPQDLDPTQDPPWVHAPGWWWPPPTYPGAILTGDDPAALAAALTAALTAPRTGQL